MSRPSLYASFTARTFMRAQQFNHLIEYLITHQYLFADDTLSQQLLTSKVLLSSTLSELAQRIAHGPGTSLLSFLKIRPQEDSVPELLTLRQLPIDMLQAQSALTPALAGALIAQPRIQDKVLLNVTPFVQSSGTLSDAIGFHSALVRDALSRSYYRDDKTTWLSPNFTQFVAKVYSMTMGTSVSQLYRLDAKTLNILTFFFALFYLAKMSSGDVASGILRSQWKKFAVPDAVDQQQLYGVIEETLGRYVPETLEEVIAVIHALNIPRLKLDRYTLINRQRSQFSADVLTTSLCLDYPPALAALIIQAFSGVPVNLGYKLKTFGFTKSKQEFEDEILRSHAFMDSLT